MIRKFYDADASDKAAETAAKFTMGEAFDAATLGVDSNENQFDDSIEDKEEKKVDDIIEKVEDKREEKFEEKKEEETKPVISDWKEAAKKAEHRKELFQLLEIDEDALNLSKDLKSDDFVKKLVIYRKEHGNLTPFIEAATRDYDKVSPEQLIMDDLQKQYSHLPSEKAAKLAKSDFNQRFSYRDDPNLTEEENRELEELTAIKLESEGLKIRAKLKGEQQTFLDSVKPVDRTAEATKIADEQKAAQKAELEKFAAMYDADPANSKLNAEKKIVLGKEKPFNYTVNPVSIREQTLDTNKFYGKFWTEKDGKEVFNTDLWNRVIAYSENPAAFEEALINHGMSQGTKTIVDDELENATVKTDKTTAVKKESISKAVAKGQPFSFNGTAVN